jgi:hypothetical protein
MSDIREGTGALTVLRLERIAAASSSGGTRTASTESGKGA